MLIIYVITYNIYYFEDFFNSYSFWISKISDRNQRNYNIHNMVSPSESDKIFQN